MNASPNVSGARCHDRKKVKISLFFLSFFFLLVSEAPTDRYNRVLAGHDAFDKSACVAKPSCVYPCGWTLGGAGRGGTDAKEQAGCSRQTAAEAHA